MQSMHSEQSHDLVTFILPVTFILLLTYTLAIEQRHKSWAAGI